MFIIAKIDDLGLELTGDDALAFFEEEQELPTEQDKKLANELKELNRKVSI